jgi:hypothetical protein
MQTIGTIEFGYMRLCNSKLNGNGHHLSQTLVDAFDKTTVHFLDDKIYIIILLVN